MKYLLILLLLSSPALADVDIRIRTSTGPHVVKGYTAEEIKTMKYSRICGHGELMRFEEHPEYGTVLITKKYWSVNDDCVTPWRVK